ncbi:hypothetical protein BD779DRAFT_1523343 [Infundibulicybe gibba]|nr:hypothetical protein BD779DRAFT_1523343 [Infundibulicybe gibba]
MRNHKTPWWYLLGRPLQLRKPTQPETILTMDTTPLHPSSLTLGTVEIGVMFSLLTHGVLTVQTYSYFRRCTDPIFMRLVISFIWSGSSLHLACMAWLLYSATITNHNLPIESIKFPVGFPLGSAIGTLVHCSVQGVYIHRMYKFSHRWHIPVFCCALTIYELGSGLAFSIVEGRFNSTFVPGRFGGGWGFLFYSFFATTAVVDVIIAISISYYLQQSRGLRTTHLIDWLIVWTIQTGVATSIAAILVIVLFAAHKEDNAWLGVYIFLTSLYPLALVALLNGRERLKPEDPSLRRIHVMTTITVEKDGSIRHGGNRTTRLNMDPPKPSSLGSSMNSVRHSSTDSV